MSNFMQNLLTQESVTTKQLLPNRFWLLLHNGSKIGTIQKHTDTQYVITSVDSTILTMTEDEVNQKFDLDTSAELPEIEPEKLLYDFPTKHVPYNGVYDVHKKMALYSKSENSDNMYAAGYFLVHFPKGWVRGFCPKLSTIEGNEYQGPFKTVTEQKQAFSLINRSK